MERVSFSCQFCGKEKYVLPGEFRSKQFKFCSKDCAGKAATTSSVSFCLSCNKQITIKSARVGKNNFCSKDCFYYSRRKPDSKWRDPKQIKQYMADYHKKKLETPGYREKINEKCRVYAKNNREKRTCMIQNYRSKKRQNGGTVTAAQWKKIKNMYGDVCIACGSMGPLSMDHIVAVSRGGSHSVDNIQPLCMPCNIKKGAKTVDYRSAVVS